MTSARKGLASFSLWKNDPVMCCFSRPVEFVSATRIFARPTTDGRQVLVYRMQFGATEAMAMILPIPVAAGSGENALRFIDLSNYGIFFTMMERGFPPPPNFGGSLSAPAPATRALKVMDVGNFVASFVPSVKDFEHLDERFRLAPGVWEKLGIYDRFGFAVFQLKPGRRAVHPMAFTFPTATPRQVFFPTVHIHDGKVHSEADFDHILYCQVPRAGARSVTEWQESDHPAANFLDIPRTKDCVVGDYHVFRHSIIGREPNKDVVLNWA